VSKTIARNLKKGDLIVFRSTLVPGFMRGFIKPILEESRLEAGKDFYLGYASERVAEGKAFEEFENMPTLVSGINEKSVRETTSLLEVITKADIIPASSFEVVETAKVLENISRDINIAMVNEFAKFTRALGIDIFEVIKVANTHKRVNLLNPGPGVGGYCIPNAFYYLNAKGRELDIDLELSLTARRINKDTPVRVAQIALEKLTSKPGESKICILGMAMKDYSSDDRLSPAFDVIKTLQEKGVDVVVYDPAISNDYDYLVEDINKALKDADGIIILAKQEGINLKDLDRFKEMLKDNNPFILDTKNVYTREEVETKGILYESI
ncbi:MAG TPA: nucleotide sugar dehydrogenase, partial [Clostridia bacterium]|nr:nucleotide sugar dehydrogenase [Clostridia bacterium]